MSKRIPLTQGQFAIVDDEDHEELMKYKWYACYCTTRKTYFASRKYNNAQILMHRQIINTPKGMHTDHVNHDTLDNRKSNIRICTHSQNMMNRKRFSNNKSGHRGICFHKHTKKWAAYINVKNKRTWIGIFKEKKDAIKAREQAEEKYFGKFAYKNKKQGELLCQT